MDEIGPPIAYLALKEGTPVYDRAGMRIGVVEHVLADEAVDIFHGLIVHTLPLPGRHLYADADQIAELHERGVLLSVDQRQLREPGTMSAGRGSDEYEGSGESVESPLQARLRRAWDWISQHI